MLLRHIYDLSFPPQVMSFSHSSATWENPPCLDIMFVTSKRKEGELQIYRDVTQFSTVLVRVCRPPTGWLINGRVSSVGG